jgi:hypothetical protein
MKKTNPLILWIVLWIFGWLLITLRNWIAAGHGFNLGSYIFQNLMMLLWVPIYILVYYVIKFIAKMIGAADFFTGKNGLRNVFFTWLVPFVLLFLVPLFKK